MGLQDRLPSGVRIPGMLVLSVVALLIAAAFVLGSVSTLLSAITEPSVQSEDADVVSSLLENNRVLARSEERFTGRSIFYIPKAPQVPRRPAPPTAPPPPRPVVEERPPPAPRIPSVYGGPKVTGVLDKDVFFDNGERVKQGETAAGVKVLLVRGPFDVRLGWSGGEFDVSLFSELPDYFTSVPFADGSSLDIFASGGSSSASSSSSPRSSSSRLDSRGSRSSSSQVESRGASSQASRPSSPVEVPKELTDSEIEEMSRVDAVRAHGRVNAALRGDIDDETRERLENDRERLQTRIHAPSQPE